MSINNRQPALACGVQGRSAVLCPTTSLVLFSLDIIGVRYEDQTVPHFAYSSRSARRCRFFSEPPKVANFVALSNGSDWSITASGLHYLKIAKSTWKGHDQLHLFCAERIIPRVLHGWLLLSVENRWDGPL